MNHIKIVNDLARAKVLFQQRAIQAHLGQIPTGSNASHERHACATEGCTGRGVITFERGGVGSLYCADCYERIDMENGR